MTRLFLLILALAQLTAFTSALHAAILTDEVMVDTSAVIGVASDSDSNINGGPTADSDSTINGNSGDVAQALAEATLGGAVRASSQAGGAGGTAGPMLAESRAGWTATYQVDGTGTLDIDLLVQLDGFLETGNNNSGSSIQASVGLDISIGTVGSNASIYSGFASLSEPSVGLAMLETEGDFAGEGTNNHAACDIFGTCYIFDVAQSVDDVLELAPNERFSVTVEMFTAADAPGGFESVATANFFNTLNINLSSDNPSASIRLVPNPVPLPPMLVPFVAAVVLLRSRKIRATGTDRSKFWRLRAGSQRLNMPPAIRPRSSCNRSTRFGPPEAIAIFPAPRRA